MSCTNCTALIRTLRSFKQRWPAARSPRKLLSSFTIFPSTAAFTSAIEMPTITRGDLASGRTWGNLIASAFVGFCHGPAFDFGPLIEIGEQPRDVTIRHLFRAREFGDEPIMIDATHVPAWPRR